MRCLLVRGGITFWVHCHSNLRGMRLCTILMRLWSLLFHSQAFHKSYLKGPFGNQF